MSRDILKLRREADAQRLATAKYQIANAERLHLPPVMVECAWDVVRELEG